VLEVLLKKGNVIKDKVVQEWPECDLEVNLLQPFTLDSIRESFSLPPFIHLWEIRSPHDVGRERGISCTICKHTISCPVEDGPTLTVLQGGVV
jgi:hypothetical protein